MATVTKPTASEILTNLGMTIDEVDRAASYVEAVVDLVDRTIEQPSTIELANGERLHRFQIVKEGIEMPLVENETSYWVVTQLDPFTVTMAIPTNWDKKTVTIDEICGEAFEPLTHSDGAPVYGY